MKIKLFEFIHSVILFQSQGVLEINESRELVERSVDDPEQRLATRATLRRVAQNSAVTLAKERMVTQSLEEWKKGKEGRVQTILWNERKKRRKKKERTTFKASSILPFAARAAATGARASAACAAVRTLTITEEGAGTVTLSDSGGTGALMSASWSLWKKERK